MYHTTSVCSTAIYQLAKSITIHKNKTVVVTMCVSILFQLIPCGIVNINNTPHTFVAVPKRISVPKRDLWQKRPRIGHYSKFELFCPSLGRIASKKFHGKLRWSSPCRINNRYNFPGLHTVLITLQLSKLGKNKNF